MTIWTTPWTILMRMLTLFTSLRRLGSQQKFPNWQKICSRTNQRCRKTLRVRLLMRSPRLHRRVESLSTILSLRQLTRRLSLKPRKNLLKWNQRVVLSRLTTRRTTCQRSQEANLNFRMVDGSVRSVRTTISRVEKNAIGAKNRGQSKIWAESLFTCSSPNRRTLKQLDLSCSE